MMRKTRKGTGPAIIGLIVLGTATPALACTLPPPGYRAPSAEEVRNSNLAHQRRQWEGATAIFVARVTRFHWEPASAPVDNGDVTLRPIVPIHGPLPEGALSSEAMVWTSCGPSSPFTSQLHEDRDYIVLMGARPTWGRAAFDVIAVDELIATDLRAAVEAALDTGRP